MKKIIILGTAAALFSVIGASHAAGDAAAGKAKATTICAACHAADGNSVVPTFPKLAGQHAAYLESSLKAFRDGTRTNPIMAPQAKPLTDDDIANLAAYYACQTPK